MNANLHATLTDAEEKPIDRSINRLTDSCSRTVAVVEDLLEQRRELWARIDDLNSENRRLQSIIDSMRLRNDL